jgi:transposase
MRELRTIGLDTAKNVFQAHGADGGGAVIFRKKLPRKHLLPFFADQPPCLVALEACGASHHWAREIAKLGHQVKLIPPKYVKPFVKRQKNDQADAEAICEAAQRPTMRFVSVKSDLTQANAVVFRTRDLLIRQRTQLINAVRGHLSEFGYVVKKGPSHMAELMDIINDVSSGLPEAARICLKVLSTTLEQIDEKVAGLDAEIGKRAKQDPLLRRLTSIPGVGPITAAAISALAPPPEAFAKGRDFAAWVGLTPLQQSTGGKQKLGATSKMGERTIRRLLIIGAAAVIRKASPRTVPEGSWLARMLARKPTMLVTVALANKMARIVWALLSKNEMYRAPIGAAG